MNTTVTLQENLPLSLLPFLVILLGAAILSLLYLIPYWKNKRAAQPVVKQPVQVQQVNTVPQDTITVKGHYMHKVDEIQRDLQMGLLDERKAAQALSITIRDFVNQMTGLNVQNYTLTEIHFLNMPTLEALIQEYYAPEFAAKKKWDSKKSFEKTKRAISKWT